jgi:hypothetical protein
MSAAGVQILGDIDKRPFEAAVQPVWRRFLSTPELRALAADIQALA